VALIVILHLWFQPPCITQPGFTYICTTTVYPIRHKHL